MSELSGSRLGAGLLRHSRTIGIGAVSTAVAVAGLGVAPAATSAPSSACPDAFAGVLTKGLPVHGLTVDSGTTPEPFTGEVLGVIKDGIAPGLDMIMAELTSAEVDRVGIWQGMSGSPVYAADGSLIGAVSYGLSWGSSPVAGITPAGDMLDLLSDPASPAARTTLEAAAEKDTVAIPRAMARTMVSTGAVESDETGDGMSRLPIPLGISGFSGNDRRAMIKKSLALGDTRIRMAGSAPAATGDAEPIVPGGNLAASLSYGDVSAVGVGTATAVCGDEVIAFGHPMSFTGPSELTMHNADAIYVQADSLGPGFKVANPSGPVGGVAHDGLAGLLGISGAVPETSHVSSDVSVAGEDGSRHGETFVSVRDAMADIAAMHLLANHDRVFDGITGGSAELGWSIRGEREDGSPFSLDRADKFANDWDISYEPTFDLFDQIWQLQNNGMEDVTITDVDVTSVMDRDFTAYAVSKVRVREGGAWRRLPARRPVFVVGGTTKRFEVTLTSAQLPTARVVLAVPIPRNAKRRSGVLEILGGNSYYGGEDFYFEDFYGSGGSMPGETFDQLLAKLESAPRNDRVLASLTLFGRGGQLRRMVREPAAAVVDGGVFLEVQSILKGDRRR